MIEVNTKDLQNKLEKAKKQTRRKIKPFLQKSMISTNEKLSKYTVPKVEKQWSKNIPARMYKRPIFNIKAVLQDLQQVENKPASKKFKDILRGQLKEGNRFFIIKNGLKKKRIIFGKNKRQMQTKYKRIRFRGFIKIMFGLKLLLEGINNKFFSKLLSASPALSTLVNKYNRVRYNETNEIFTLQNVNDAIPNKSLMDISKKKAEDYLFDEMKKNINEIKGAYK